MSDAQKLCPICGGPVPAARSARERIYCSRSCNSRALYLRRLQRAAEDTAPKQQRFCAVCGADITDLPGGRRYCDFVCSKIGEALRKAQSRLAAKELKLQGQPAPPKPTAILRRKCHDCGTPTSDYRCPACLKAWRIKNGVNQDGGTDTDDSFSGGVIGGV